MLYQRVNSHRWLAVMWLAALATAADAGWSEGLAPEAATNPQHSVALLPLQSDNIGPDYPAIRHEVLDLLRQNVSAAGQQVVYDEYLDLVLQGIGYISLYTAEKDAFIREIARLHRADYIVLFYITERTISSLMLGSHSLGRRHR